MTDPAVRLSEAQKYVVAPLAPFPKRWRDAKGPIRVMAGPVDGYLLVRRPACIPFVLHVSEITNAKKHPILGPFELVENCRAALTQGLGTKP